jgi:hypothetical protein
VNPVNDEEGFVICFNMHLSSPSKKALTIDFQQNSIPGTKIKYRIPECELSFCYFRVNDKASRIAEGGWMHSCIMVDFSQMLLTLVVNKQKVSTSKITEHFPLETIHISWDGFPQKFTMLNIFSRNHYENL